MANIGIYGGTFNPPHLGHVLAAKAAKEALGLNKVLLVPDAEPPHKALPEGSPTPVQRVEMARLATQDEPWLEVSEMELGRPGKSYTSDTLRALAEQYSNDTLYLLMGTDMFLSLHTWHEPDVICHLAVIVGMHREEDKDGTMEQQKSLLEERFGAKAVVLHNVPLEISSTHLRRMLILGGADHYMNPGVLSYIRSSDRRVKASAGAGKCAFGSDGNDGGAAGREVRCGSNACPAGRTAPRHYQGHGRPRPVAIAGRV